MYKIEMMVFGPIEKGNIPQTILTSNPDMSSADMILLFEDFVRDLKDEKVSSSSLEELMNNDS